MPETQSPAPLRILIADDELPARQRLQTLLSREPGVDLVGTAVSGREIIEQIKALRSEGHPADIVFLDIHMPEGNGLDVVREVGPEAMPVTIFVTAYDEHAVSAFELAALDYLLKPFENERFRQALARAREAVRLRQMDVVRGRLVALLQGEAAPESPIAPPAPVRPKYLERIAVEMRGQIRVVPIDRVDYLTSEGNYVRIHAGSDSYLISDTLSAIEERLDPTQFFRIHRSTIVRIDRVEAILTAPGGDYAVRLTDGSRLNLARGRRDLLAAHLGLDTH